MADKPRSRQLTEVRAIIMCLLLLFIGGTVIAMFLGMTIPDQMMDAFLMIIGALLKSMADAQGYFFGSSQDSGKKNETIAALAASQASPLTQTTTTTLAVGEDTNDGRPAARTTEEPAATRAATSGGVSTGFVGAGTFATAPTNTDPELPFPVG